MGLGVFYAAGTGDSTTRIEGSADIDRTLHFTGSGIWMDTNISRDETFNYRLSLASGSYGDRDAPYDSIVMIHDLGFSPARNRRSRLWVGPEIMLNFIDDSSTPESPRLFGFGMGLAIGGNVNLAKRLGFNLKAAYISQTLTGNMIIAGTRTDVTTKDGFIYTSLSLSLRFGERF